MCVNCSSKTYGQEQPEARAADKAKIARVLKAKEEKNQRKANAHLN